VRVSFVASNRQTTRMRPPRSRAPNAPGGPPGSSSVEAPGRYRRPRSRTTTSVIRSPARYGISRNPYVNPNPPPKETVIASLTRTAPFGWTSARTSAWTRS
jgi:hypothetical protein